MGAVVDRRNAGNPERPGARDSGTLVEQPPSLVDLGRSASTGCGRTRGARRCRILDRTVERSVRKSKQHLAAQKDPQLACDRDATTPELVAEVLQGLLGVPRANVESILVPLRREDALEEPLSDRHVGARQNTDALEIELLLDAHRRRRRALDEERTATVNREKILNGSLPHELQRKCRRSMLIADGGTACSARAAESPA